MWKRNSLYQIFFLRTSYFSICLIWNEYLNIRPKSNVWKPGWKQADTCLMFTLFRNFADLCLKNYPFLLISRIRTDRWKITPFFAKVGTSVVYYQHVGRVCGVWGVGVGCGGGGGGGGGGGVEGCVEGCGGGVCGGGGWRGGGGGGGSLYEYLYYSLYKYTASSPPATSSLIWFNLNPSMGKDK